MSRRREPNPAVDEVEAYLTQVVSEVARRDRDRRSVGVASRADVTVVTDIAVLISALLSDRGPSPRRLWAV